MTEKPAPDVVEAGKPHPLSQIWADAFHAWEKDGHWAACESLAAALQARPDAALVEEVAERIAKHIAKEESTRCKTLDGALNHQANWKRILPEVRAIIEASGLSALRTHDDTLESAVQIYAWLGYWRDQIPAEAVSQLQDILGPLERKDGT